ncbi:MAG: peptide chain release factor N(5)-glutamine methyltransferase [Pseudomonadota bacterium]|nr:peptide chain release factor N(5)-glutamine methyltransferase [Pseudomonadota bacterium]
MDVADGEELTVAAALAQARHHDDRIDLRVLLGHALERPLSWLLAHPEATIDGRARLLFESLWQRRRAGEPVAYLTGEREFHGLSLRITPAVLIPRPETELLVDCALELLPAGKATRAADLGTGSGAIAVALAFRRPLLQAVATDISSEALEVAGDNARRLGVAGRCSFRHGAWLAALGRERFDCLVSNPPYIAEHDAHLAQGDLRFEPRAALAAGPDGLRDLHIIVAGAGAHLHAGGHLLLEHGHDQAAAVRTAMQATGFSLVHSVRDLAGIERVTLGRWHVDHAHTADYANRLS